MVLQGGKSIDSDYDVRADFATGSGSDAVGVVGIGGGSSEHRNREESAHLQPASASVDHALIGDFVNGLRKSFDNVTASEVPISNRFSPLAEAMETCPILNVNSDASVVDNTVLYSSDASENAISGLQPDLSSTIIENA